MNVFNLNKHTDSPLNKKKIIVIICIDTCLLKCKQLNDLRDYEHLNFNRVIPYKNFLACTVQRGKEAIHSQEY